MVHLHHLGFELPIYTFLYYCHLMQIYQFQLFLGVLGDVGLLTQPLLPFRIMWIVQKSETSSDAKPKSLGVSPLMVMNTGPRCSSW